MAAFQRERIRDVYKKKYPKIFDGTSTITDDHDLLRFLADDIIDLKILVDTSTTAIQATEDDTVPLRPIEGEPPSPGPSQSTSSGNSGQFVESRFVPSAYDMC
jgi:hypothetical protein